MSLCLSFVASLVMHLVTWLSHRKSRTSPNSIPSPIHLFCTSHSLNTTYSRSFVSSLAWFYFKFQIVFMQEREELRALRREKKMSREWKIKRKICVWKKERKIIYMCMREWKRVIEKEKRKERKKNRNVKKNICVWENERKWLKKKKREEKEKRGMAEKIWEGWIKWKKNKVQGRMLRCWETKLSLFFQPCAIRQRGRHRCLVVIFSFALAHVHHSISSYPWYPHIWINSHDHWLWKVNNH
jgi:hypothetical protein